MYGPLILLLLRQLHVLLRHVLVHGLRRKSSAGEIQPLHAGDFHRFPPAAATGVVMFTTREFSTNSRISTIWPLLPPSRRYMVPCSLRQFVILQLFRTTLSSRKLLLCSLIYWYCKTAIWAPNYQI